MTDYQRNCDCSCQRCGFGRLIWGAILVTIGVLFLLAEFTRWDFDQTWPALLIVIGVLLVYRHSASTEGHIDRAVPQPPQNPDVPQVPHV